MANVNMTGFDRRRAGQQERHVHHRAEEGGDPDERAGEQAEPDGDLAEHDEPREPGLRVVVEQELHEAAVPLERDRRAPALRDRDRTLSNSPGARRRRRSSRRRPSLCQPASSHAKPTKIRIGSHSKPGACVAEQVAGECRAFDLDDRRVRVLAIHEQDPMTTMDRTQNVTVASVRTVSLMSSGLNHGFSIQNSTAAASTASGVTRRRAVISLFPFGASVPAPRRRWSMRRPEPRAPPDRRDRAFRTVPRVTDGPCRRAAVSRPGAPAAGPTGRCGRPTAGPAGARIRRAPGAASRSTSGASRPAGPSSRARRRSRSLPRSPPARAPRAHRRSRPPSPARRAAGATPNASNERRRGSPSDGAETATPTTSSPSTAAETDVPRSASAASSSACASSGSAGDTTRLARRSRARVRPSIEAMTAGEPPGAGATTGTTPSASAGHASSGVHHPRSRASRSSRGTTTARTAMARSADARSACPCASDSSMPALWSSRNAVGGGPSPNAAASAHRVPPRRRRLPRRLAVRAGQPDERPRPRHDPVGVVAAATGRQPAAAGVAMRDRVGEPRGLAHARSS